MRSVHRSNHAVSRAPRAWTGPVRRGTGLAVAAFFAAAATAAQPVVAGPFDGRAAIGGEALVAAIPAQNRGPPARTEALNAAHVRAAGSGVLDDPMFSYDLAPPRHSDRWGC